MAKDDYHVIVYQILSYLYQRLKKGEPVDVSMLAPDSPLFKVNKRYWAYIIYNLSRYLNDSPEMVHRSTVKSHLFMTKHDLGNGELEYFFPDYEIAQSWQRLMDDNMKIQPHDLILLEHEYAELSFMKDGMTQHEAHKKAEELYNCSRALKERK